MLKIYDVEQAQKTILRRSAPDQGGDYPPALINSVERIFGSGTTPAAAVTQILNSVRDEGDNALRHWSQRLDSVELETFRIPKETLAAAVNQLSPALIYAVQKAAARIRDFHSRQPLPNWQTTEMGGILGQRVTPIRRVGIYVPGGSAPLPSSLLMSAVPAQVAGVPEIVICTPPNPHPAILAAAHLCGLETVFQIGGAQAIAAMAFGTETVPRVDKIVGPGNLFVTLAKQQLYGLVGLDGLAGPTETMVIADAAANPAWIAADLLAQAEHDPLAAAILLTPSRSLAEAVQVEIGRQLERLSRAEIIAQSLENNGGAVITADMETAVQLANNYAPEHLCLAVADPHSLASKITNAGGIFLGEYSFEVLGDYIAGPSHIMPTGGTARFASPLNVLDFVKINSIIGLDAATGRELSRVAAEIAQAETLTAHAAAAERRIILDEQRGMKTEFQVSPDALQRYPAPTDFIRRQIREMPAYEPVLPFEVLSQQLGFPPEQLVKLDANENPYGPLPAVFKALSELPYAHIYPDPESRLLRQGLSDYHDIPVENILAGAGADELIDLLMRLFLDDGDTVLNCPPTFGMYAFDAAIQGARVVNIPRQADFSLDTAGIVQAVNEYQPKILFLTSPNNPDGRLIPPETLQTLLSLPVIVVLDEAYIEFAPPGTTAAQMVLERPNLIILRTFSKWAGLAGLRVGYGFFPSPLMPHLWKMKQPYNVSVTAATAAIVSLQHAAELEANGRKIIAERERLYQSLTAVPWLQPYPSQANFILCRVQDRPAHAVRQQLARQGILVRYFQKPGLEDCIRISVGRRQDTDRLLQALNTMSNA